MKRDMDLIRQLLLRAEAAPDGQLTVDDPLETYQVRLMIDAGLADGQISEELFQQSRSGSDIKTAARWQ